MDRRSFLKLAAASPALVSPAYVRRAHGNAQGYTLGSQAPTQSDFTFYSPLAEA